MKKLLPALISIILASTSAFAEEKVYADRWLEIDLYWFEKDQKEESVDAFWERYSPLMEGIQGWKGIILNIGWTGGFIFEWQGDINAEVALTNNMKKYPWFKDGGYLDGSTIERTEAWKHRFMQAEEPEIITYEKWTYADLKELTALLKMVAAEKYHLDDVRVGSFILGLKSIYGGSNSDFSARHPEAYRGHTINIPARLNGDSMKYGAFPDGIPQDTPLSEFFGKQWGNMSRELDMDVIVLRDHILGSVAYRRGGPYGKKAPEEPKQVKEWSDATADWVKQTKISNPDALVIGYSNGASAVADWRINCVDLEKIAGQGFLDAWIDQTWAGAWNEVAQRPVDYSMFWNRPTLGWTYQLAYTLIHAAVLAETRTKHYFLTETFDAWESWDIIHGAPERLRWGIWALSHAAVKTPDGLKMPSGSYISWCNKGKELLTEEDVFFLTAHSNAAMLDAGETNEMMGPTMVYCRSAMEWQSENHPDKIIKEWIDEQTGTLMKWSVPVLSSTRSEYLPDVESDMFLFQTPVHLKENEKQHIMDLIESGKPCAVLGSPAGGIDEDILALIGVSTEDTEIENVQYIAHTSYRTEGIFESVPHTFPLHQAYTENKTLTGVDVVYSIADSPCLTRNHTEGKQVIFWDPPEFATNFPIAHLHRQKPALDEILGSVYPYVLTARTINDVLKTNDLPYTDYISPLRPVSSLMWKTNNGNLNLLVGQMEEGINHSADRKVSGTFVFPIKHQKPSLSVFDLWSNTQINSPDHRIPISLNAAETKLLILEAAQLP